jgi:hypothetical protein
MAFIRDGENVTVYPLDSQKAKKDEVKKVEDG